MKNPHDPANRGPRREGTQHEPSQDRLWQQVHSQLENLAEYRRSQSGDTPSREQLQAYLADTLSPEENEAIEERLSWDPAACDLLLEIETEAEALPEPTRMEEGLAAIMAGAAPAPVVAGAATAAKAVAAPRQGFQLSSLMAIAASTALVCLSLGWFTGQHHGEQAWLAEDNTPKVFSGNPLVYARSSGVDRSAGSTTEAEEPIELDLSQGPAMVVFEEILLSRVQRYHIKDSDSGQVVESVLGSPQGPDVEEQLFYLTVLPGALEPGQYTIEIEYRVPALEDPTSQQEQTVTWLGRISVAAEPEGR